MPNILKNFLWVIFKDTYYARSVIDYSYPDVHGMGKLG